MQLIWSEISSQNQWLSCVQMRVIVTLSRIDLVFFCRYIDSDLWANLVIYPKQNDFPPFLSTLNLQRKSKSVIS